MKKYIIGGAGAFLSDIFDLIHSNQGRVTGIYQNEAEVKRDGIKTLGERVALLRYDVEIQHQTLDSFVRPQGEVEYAIGCLTVY